MVIPRFIATKDYIDQELDELSKEDFYRLKKVLQNKRRDEDIAKNENVQALNEIKETINEEDETEMID